VNEKGINIFGILSHLCTSYTQVVDEMDANFVGQTLRFNSNYEFLSKSSFAHGDKSETNC
jgi:hypothetical protein